MRNLWFQTLSDISIKVNFYHYYYIIPMYTHNFKKAIEYKSIQSQNQISRITKKISFFILKCYTYKIRIHFINFFASAISRFIINAMIVNTIITTVSRMTWDNAYVYAIISVYTIYHIICSVHTIIINIIIYCTLCFIHPKYFL